MTRDEIQFYLSFVECSSYDDWMRVGMAVKAADGELEDWLDWSRTQPGFRSEEDCRKHWDSFSATGGVGAGTLVAMARRNGAQTDPQLGGALEWDAEIEDDGDGYVRPTVPKEWNPTQDLITYLETLFKPDDIIGYVTDDIRTEDDRIVPGRGTYTRRAGDLIKALRKHGISPESVGNVNETAGGWIRFNPLDGEGVKNDNVVDFRFALIECDTLPVERQRELIVQLQLPVACLVSSGGKSVHAITHIDADSYEEYKKRVEFLYHFCEENGLPVDKANRNPSRLSRMPGLMRNGNRQQLLRTNIGKASWNDWMSFVENPTQDDLPDFVELSGVLDSPPPLAPDLISGVLRQGHKAIVQGPSKAGKSYLLIQLACAIADGLTWLGFQCAPGKVLYINLEIDQNSFYNRFAQVYRAWGTDLQNRQNLQIWPLRGRSMPIQDLSPKLIRKIKGQNYAAVILDPIYKLSMGDENSAGDVGRFCNELDKIASECGCSIIYCHHHAKGAAGGKKTTDRSSGSGVFGRDADAIIDLTPLMITQDRQPWYEQQNAQAFRVEMQLREYPPVEPIDVWFRHPIHVIDRTGNLKQFHEEGSVMANLSRNRNYSTSVSRRESLLEAYELWEDRSPKLPPTVQQLADMAEKSYNTIRKWLEENDSDFEIDGGRVVRK